VPGGDFVIVALADGGRRRTAGLHASVTRGGFLVPPYGAGLRRGELVALLDVDDYAPETGELRIHHGKGQKDRLVYVTNGGADALAAWMHARGAERGPLFSPVTKAGRTVPRRLTDQVVLRVLAEARARSRRRRVLRARPA